MALSLYHTALTHTLQLCLHSSGRVCSSKHGTRRIKPVQTKHCSETAVRECGKCGLCLCVVEFFFFFFFFLGANRNKADCRSVQCERDGPVISLITLTRSRWGWTSRTELRVFWKVLWRSLRTRWAKMTRFLSIRSAALWPWRRWRVKAWTWGSGCCLPGELHGVCVWVCVATYSKCWCELSSPFVAVCHSCTFVYDRNFTFSWSEVYI